MFRRAGRFRVDRFDPVASWSGGPDALSTAGQESDAEHEKQSFCHDIQSSTVPDGCGAANGYVLAAWSTEGQPMVNR